MLVRPDMLVEQEVDWLDRAMVERRPRMTLALDPGLLVGWAKSDGTSGVLDLSQYDDHGEAVWTWREWLKPKLQDVTHLATEQSIFGRGNSLAELVTTLGMTAHSAAWERGIARQRHTADKVRKALLGRARVPWRTLGITRTAATRVMDNDILAAVTALGFTPETVHAADAAALLCMVEGRTA